MPEKSFYISDEERINLFNFIVSIDGKVIADKPRITSNLEYIGDQNEFIHMIQNECVGFFVVSPSFSIQPLLSEQNRFLIEPSFSVTQRHGGPYIGLSLYRGFAHDAEVKYKRTDIFYYPKYINLNNYFEEIPASNELKQFYKRITDYIKSRCKTLSSGSKKYLVSTDLSI